MVAVREIGSMVCFVGERRLGDEQWADIHELLYRWMYRTGRKQQGNISPVQYGNYAWFHGALVEMQDKDRLEDREIVRIFSNAARQDLSRWFRIQWQIE